jgi:hypothetical protein
MLQPMSRVQSGLGMPALGGLSSQASIGQILFDDFNGTGGVPKNWLQIPGDQGDVTEKPHDLTITDPTGASNGIVLPSSNFPPQGVKTTIQAQINRVNSDGNAIFGLVGLSAQGSLTGYLAAGIDAQGNVFIIEQDPSIQQTIVQLGVDQTYKGGSIAMSLIIDSNSETVTVTAPGFSHPAVPFVAKFSLAAAFSNGAIPALVGASQPNTKGGSASFGSIGVSTALGR